jgi:hypothetical protein
LLLSPSATAKIAHFTLRKKSGFTSFTVANLLHVIHLAQSKRIRFAHCR